MFKVDVLNTVSFDGSYILTNVRFDDPYVVSFVYLVSSTLYGRPFL
jgi:hypothetical protein